MSKLILAILSVILSFCLTTQQDVFRSNCKDIRESGTFVFAKCRKNDGTWNVETGVCRVRCRGKPIININGVLQCPRTS